MIRNPTTFVIGAGASHVYGLPLGSKLLSLAKGLSQDKSARALVNAVSGSASDVNDFIADLEDHTAESIDEFLETRHFDSRVVEIGRIVIAVLMGRALIARRYTGGDRDWLGYLFKKMREGARDGKEFAEGNAGVRFVTFNFDTLIEDRLREAVTRSFTKDVADGEMAIVVQHVHGELPRAHFQSFFQFDTYSRLPENDRWIEWVRQAAACVRIVRDEISDDDLTPIRECMLNARTICFLGFSYHPENLRRLAVSRVPDDSYHRWFGSAHGFLDGERLGIQDRLGSRTNHLILGDETDDCLAILRKFNVFES